MEEEDLKSLNIKTTYIFRDHINRVWKILTNKETFIRIYMSDIDSFEFRKGSKFEKGIEFFLRWKSIFFMTITIEDKSHTENYKMFKLKVKDTFPVEINFTVTYHLYWNTVEQNTFYIHDVNFDELENMLIYNCQTNRENRIF